MLEKFEVKGFKNFEKKIVINFSDVHDYKFNTECVANNLLSKMIVYGKNSVGKTNLGLAIFDIVAHLTDKNVSPNLYDYYLNANTLENAEFKYNFKFENDTIEYIYSKNGNRIIVCEEISINGDIIFKYDHLTKKGSYEGLKALNPSLNLDFENIESVLRYVINNTKLDDTHPLRKMMKFISSMLWFRNLDENRYIGYKNNTSDYFSFIEDEKTLMQFSILLKEIGVQEQICTITDKDGVTRLYFLKNKTLLPFFQTASSGTKALYNFFYWYKTAKDVSFMFIDEFDAYYHYELSESIVKLLEKMKNTQVILTSHNTNLLSNRIMRPDCFFILTFDKLTSLVNATDRELREGHNLEKLYMSGEFDE